MPVSAICHRRHTSPPCHVTGTACSPCLPPPAADIWLQNIGISKLLAGHISWYYANPKAKVVGWKRLVARFDRDPDLLLVALLTGPARLLWSVLRGRRKLSDVMDMEDWNELPEDQAKAAQLMAAHRKQLRAAGAAGGAAGKGTGVTGRHRRASLAGGGAGGRTSVYGAAAAAPAPRKSRASAVVSGRRPAPPAAAAAAAEGEEEQAGLDGSAESGASRRISLTRLAATPTPPERSVAAAAAAAKAAAASGRKRLFRAQTLPSATGAAGEEGRGGSPQKQAAPPAGGVTPAKGGGNGLQRSKSGAVRRGSDGAVTSPEPLVPLLRLGPPGATAEEEAQSAAKRKLSYASGAVQSPRAAELEGPSMAVTLLGASPAAPLVKAHQDASGAAEAPRLPRKSGRASVAGVSGRKSKSGRASVNFARAGLDDDSDNTSAAARRPSRKSGAIAIAPRKSGRASVSARASVSVRPDTLDFSGGGGLAARPSSNHRRSSRYHAPLPPPHSRSSGSGPRNSSAGSDGRGTGCWNPLSLLCGGGGGAAATTAGGGGGRGRRWSRTSEAGAAAARRAAAAERLRVPKIDREYERTVEDARDLRLKRWVAVGCVYVTWVLLSWFTFVCACNYGQSTLQELRRIRAL